MQGNLLRETQQEHEDLKSGLKALSPALRFLGTLPLLRARAPRLGPRRPWKVGRGCGATLTVFLLPIPTPLLQLPASLVRAVQGPESL